jgi:release factor glutamine methyltransferase
MSLARIKDVSYDKSVVYEPSEDSFLLADAVVDEIWKKDTSNARKRLANEYNDDDENNKERSDDDFVSVEIGVGSGYVLCSHAMSYQNEMMMMMTMREKDTQRDPTREEETTTTQTTGKRKKWRFIGVDVNGTAVEHAKETMRNHGMKVVGDDDNEDGREDVASSPVSIEIFRGDMLEDDRFYRSDAGRDDFNNTETSKRERIKEPIDVLLFNPPYVVTPSEEIYDPSSITTKREGEEGTTTTSYRPAITAAWAGGLRGREVLDRILGDIKSWLRPNGGTFLVVAYAQNDVEEMISILQNQGLEVEIAKRTQADEEALVVIKAVRLNV